MTAARKIRVLIVDDSAVVRRLAQETLSADPEIEVIGAAADPYAARDLLRTLSPDVITLDLEMPRMDGLTFLRLLMAQKPIPVVVMSSLSQRGSDFALEALRLGAIDVIGKPGGSASFGDLGPQLIAKVKAAAHARPRTAVAPGALRPAVAPARRYHPRSLILLGSSTGGTEALREVLTSLPAGLPPIAIVQHIPAMFSRTFAERLDTLCSITVREAVHGERLEPGTALIAPGNFHLLLHWSGDHYTTRVITGPPVWHQRPAVDLLFKSVSDNGAAPHALAGVLTGMGRDGADGLLGLRNLGARTFAQDEATSVIYGMPRAAWENGGAQARLPLDRVADYIVARCGEFAPAPALRCSTP
ncbi:MAG TPA: chemotaxis response regulator protein-glutamate methylesterase [Opitutaceae bacterium]|nr:chemotaxis response regulator protein-glutamate methylesterase [Opitutaceae bacterium]